MKAKPVILSKDNGYIKCATEDATHLMLNIPGPTGCITLPVITKGSRRETNSWTWNGDTEKPTLKPSVLTKCHSFKCHSWINDGKVQFLGDSSHEYANTTIDLLEIL